MTQPIGRSLRNVGWGLQRGLGLLITFVMVLAPLSTQAAFPQNNGRDNPLRMTADGAFVFPSSTPLRIVEAEIDTSINVVLGGLGGTAPYSFAVTGGALPAGVTLATDGQLSGSDSTAGTYNFDVTLTDSSDPALSITRSFQIVLLNPAAPLVADAGGPYTIVEGDSVALDGSNSTSGFPIETYAWDCDDDGTFELSSGSPTGQICSFPEDGTFPVSLRVTDDQSNTNTDTTDVNVANQPPTNIFIAANPILLPTTGGDVTLVVRWTDAGVEDDHTVVINWGDGTTETFTFDGTGTSYGAIYTHTYTDPPGQPDPFDPSQPLTFLIDVTISDDDGGSVLTQVPMFEDNNLTFGNEGPTVTLSGPTSASGGTTVSYSFTTTDPDSSDGFTLDRYDCGTGGIGSNILFSTANGAGSFTCDFPTANTSTTVSVQVSDDTAIPDEDSISVSVNDDAITVNLSGPVLVDQNDVVDYAFSVEDPINTSAEGSPSSNAPYTGIFSCGANGVQDNLVFDDTRGSGTLTCSFPTENVVSTISAELTGAVGNSGSASLNVSVGSVVITGAPASSFEGTEITLGSEVTFPSGQTVADLAWEVTLDGTVIATGSDPSISFTPADGDGTVEATLTATSTESGETASKTVTIAVENVPPTIGLSGLNNTDEGDTFTLNFGAINDPGDDTVTEITVDWGDGTPSETFPAGTASADHVYADGDANPLILVGLTDEDGTYPVSGAISINIDNVAPSIDISGPASADEGVPYTLNLGAVVDPGDDTISNIHVDWGDGSSDDYATTGDVTHVYADGPGAATIEVDLTDEDGTYLAVDSQNVTINNVAPSITSITVSPSSIDENRDMALTVRFDDSGLNDTHSIHIDWGDGNTETINLNNGERAITAHHQYLDDNPTATTSDVYIIHVDVTDNDGDTDGDDAPALTVNNVKPTIDSSSVSSSAIDENGTVEVTVDFTDPGTLDTHEVTFSWDDGSPDTIVNLTEGERTASATHQYLDDDPTGTPADTRQIGITVEDDDGDSDSTVAPDVVVNDVAPVVDAGPDILGYEDVAVSLAPATFTDVGTLDSHTATIDWGDGTVESGTVTQGAGSGSVDGSHVYASPGVYTVIVEVTDDDTLAGSDTLEVTVVNGILSYCAFAGADKLKLSQNAIADCDSVDDGVGGTIPSGLGGNEEVELEKEVEVSGDLTSTGDKIDVDKDSLIHGNLTASAEVKVDKDTTIDENIHAGGLVELKQNVVVGGDVTSALAVIVDSSATVNGTVTQFGPAPEIPAVEGVSFSVTAGGDDIKVEKNETLALAPGTYGKIEVEEGGVLQLTGGLYTVVELKLKKESQVEIDFAGSPLIFDIEEKLDAHQDVQMSITSPLGDATDILIRAGEKIDLGKDGAYLGTFLAVEEVKLDENSTLVGALYGEKVEVKKFAQIAGLPALELFASVFVNPALNPTPNSAAIAIDFVPQMNNHLYLPSLSR